MATVIRDGKAIQTTMLNLPSSNIIQQKHKQHHENEIVEEHIKDTEGRIVQKNQWVKGKFLGKVNYQTRIRVPHPLLPPCDSLTMTRVALRNVS
jgi:hypothetical protein